MLRAFSLLIALPLIAGALNAASLDALRADVEARVAKLSPEHPRLFLSRNAEADLKAKIDGDPFLKKVYARTLSDADEILKEEPVQRVLIGRRLLYQSRLCLLRTMTLSFAWRMTGERKYLERAEKEMLAAAAFKDWNPSHFLDTAEMTAALGLGYDWCHTGLPAASRTTIRQAILEKGVRIFKGMRSTNNWNQVCNGGIIMGALAVCEDEPALAITTIARGVAEVPASMIHYAPDGNYPEGPMYWGYGTTYNVLLIAALESVFGTDFDLGRQPGFMASADYYVHVTGPTGLFFNYSDCRATADILPTPFWYASKRNDPSLLYYDLKRFDAAVDPEVKHKGAHSCLPLVLIWSPAHPLATPPATTHWFGHGQTPVAFHRSGWDENAAYLAIKGGTPGASHAHMDVGAFVMDVDGVRWAEDLGMQDYHSLESAGVELWDGSQNGKRWDVFRLSIGAHNTLMVNGQRQRLSGRAPILESTPGRTCIDLSSVYEGQLAKAVRSAELRADRSVLIQDDLQSGAASTVRWAMVTSAKVTIAGPGQALLERAGHTLAFRVLSPEGATLKIYPTDPPPAPTDARNEGTRMIGFEISLPENARQRLAVELTPRMK